MRLQSFASVIALSLLSACTVSSEFISLKKSPSQVSLIFSGKPTHEPYSRSLTSSPEIHWPELSSGEASAFEYAIGTESGAQNIKAWTTISTDSATTLNGLTLNSGETYYVSLRAQDSKGNRSSVVSSDGWLVDAVAPTPPASIDDNSESPDLVSSGSITWPASSDALTGISHYEISLGTTAGATDILDWTSVGNVTSYTLNGLNLAAGESYYVSIRAIDGAGNISAATNGDGFIAGGFCAGKEDWASYNESGNAGTPVDPHLICTAAQLADINSALTDSYKLMTDIDLAPYYALPSPQFKIGACGAGGCNHWDGINPFTGIFDGNNHVISNFTFDTPTPFGVGFFAVTGNQAIIKDLTLSNITVEGTGVVGGLVGYSNESTLSNIHISGIISGTNNTVGGISGGTRLTKLLSSTFTGSVSSTSDYVGGITGEIEVGSIGLSKVINSTITGSMRTGGLVGKLDKSIIYSSSVTGTVTGTTDITGGLIGEMWLSRSSNSYNLANVVGVTAVGGLVGVADSSSDGNLIINSYSVGSVSGTSEVGGLVGYLGSHSILENSYSVGSVTGTGGQNQVGFLIGNMAGGTVTNSYYLATASCTSGGPTCGSNGSSHASLDSFFEKSNAPMSSWDAVGTTADGTNDFWEFRAGDHALAYFENETSYTIPFDGEGTSTNPYTISTTTEFNSIGQNPRWMGAVFSLTASLDFDMTSFNKVGGSQSPFTGTFEGNSETLSNITYGQSTEFDVGVFGALSPGGDGVRNLTLSNLNMTGAYYTGGAVGSIVGTGLSNVHVNTGTITGGKFTGGVFGFMSHADSTQLSSTVNVIASDSTTGGLGGYVYTSKLTQSFAKGAVSGTNEVGGLLGHALTMSTFRDNYATGNVTASGDAAGGLIGYSYAQPQYSYATGNVTGADHVGGAVGHLQDNAMTRMFATGEVSGNSTSTGVGPLVGAYNGSGSSSNSAYWSGSLCTNNGTGMTCNTEGDTPAANLSEFYNATNGAMNGWNFTTTWTMVPGDYPKLSWEP